MVEVSRIIISIIVVILLLTQVLGCGVVETYELQEMTDLMSMLKSAEPGDSFFFGNYEQDNDLSNGKERIEWIILKKEDTRILAISKYVLDGKSYNNDEHILLNCPYDYNSSILEYIEWVLAWKTSSLRKWLNTTFVNEAFNSKEQSIIYKQRLDQNNKRDEVLFDSVFLLNADEAKEYFHSSSERMCYPTKYAIGQGAYPDPAVAASDNIGCDAIDSHPTCCWWLMPQEQLAAGIVYIYYDGHIYNNPDANDCIGVRPVLWIKTIK